MPGATTTYFLTTTLPGTGCSTVDTVTVYVETCDGISSVDGISSIELFPNPSSGKIVISLKNPGGEKIKIQIFNPPGQMVFAQIPQMKNGEMYETLDLSALAKGIYFLRIISETENRVMKFCLN